MLFRGRIRAEIGRIRVKILQICEILSHICYFWRRIRAGIGRIRAENEHICDTLWHICYFWEHISCFSHIYVRGSMSVYALFCTYTVISLITYTLFFPRIRQTRVSIHLLEQLYADNYTLFFATIRANIRCNYTLVFWRVYALQKPTYCCTQEMYSCNV